MAVSFIEQSFNIHCVVFGLVNWRYVYNIELKGLSNKILIIIYIIIFIYKYLLYTVVDVALANNF